jgi:hypothetical protein
LVETVFEWLQDPKAVQEWVSKLAPHVWNPPPIPDSSDSDSDFEHEPPQMCMVHFRMSPCTLCEAVNLVASYQRARPSDCSHNLCDFIWGPPLTP